MGSYTSRNRKEAGSNGQHNQYKVLNITSRIFELLKENQDTLFTISDIAVETGSVNVSQVKPKILFLIRIGCVVKYKSDMVKGHSSATFYYKYNRKW